MLTFATFFLGLVLGVHPVELVVAGPVDRVQLYLDGQSIGSAHGSPWVVECDFGDALLPHHLLAVAHDQAGKEIARAEQWINLPRSRVEAAIALEDFEGDQAGLLRLVWSSVENVAPERIEVRFDGDLLPADAEGRYLLPAYDPRQLHIVTADLVFPSNLSTRVEAGLGSRWGTDVTVDMTAVPYFDTTGTSAPVVGLEDSQPDGGRPLEVLAVDRGAAQIAVVLEESAVLGLGNHGRLLDHEGGISRSGFELESDEQIRFLAATPHRDLDRSVPFDLFPISRAFDRSHGTLPHLLTHVRFPPGHRQQINDAVAVAGIQAAASNRPRAVVLILGDRWQDRSNFEVRQVHGFLEALRVPLVVWSTGPAASRTVGEDRRPLSIRTPWGKARDISSITRFLDAVLELRRLLDAQSIAWVEGSHLPQNVALIESEGGLAAGAGAGSPSAPVESPPQPPPPQAPAVPTVTPETLSESAPPPPPSVPPAGSPTMLLAQLNRARKQLDRPPLQLAEELSRAAQRQADRWTAEDPLETGTLATWLDSHDLDIAGYRAQRWVQALAISSAGPGGVLDDWRAQQPKSYEMFLEEQLTHLGVGIGRARRMPLYAFLAAQSVEDHSRRVAAGLADLEAVRQEVLDRVNAERARARLPPLRLQHQLEHTAQRYAEQMRGRGFYGHRSPEGTTVLDRVKAAGYRPREAGENLASGPESAEKVVDGWLQSPEHRANILSRRFTETGVGVAVGEANGELRVLWVQCFGLPRR